MSFASLTSCSFPNQAFKTYVWIWHILSFSSPGAVFSFKNAHHKVAYWRQQATSCGVKQCTHDHLETKLLTDFWTLSRWWVNYKFTIWKKEVKYCISLHQTGHDSFWLWTAQGFSDPLRSSAPLKHASNSQTSQLSAQNKEVNSLSFCTIVSLKLSRDSKPRIGFNCHAASTNGNSVLTPEAWWL